MRAQHRVSTFCGVATALPKKESNMRHATILAATLLGAVAAQADNSINLIDRTDFRANIYDDSSGQQSNNQFDIQYLRVDFKGNLADDVKYRLRLRLDKTTIKDPAKGVSDFANYAYIEPKFNDMFSLRFGKLWTYQGGWEIDNSTSDVYLLSGMDEIVSSYGLGVDPILSVAGQQFHLVVTNSGVGYGSDATKNRFLNYGVAYQGMVADLVQPMLSWQLMPKTGWSKGVSVWAVGAKVDPKPIGGELDLQGSSDAGTKEDLVSVSGTFRFNGGAFRPQLKFFYDMHSNDGTDEGTVLGFAPAVEYFPWTDREFRIHLAYTGKETSPKGGTSTYDQQVFLGIKGVWGLK
jgi:hypothetical protein